MNNKLKRILLTMEKRGQALRLSGRWTMTVDKKNTLDLKQIVAKNGWPLISLVGEEGSHAAWLIVQHSPSLHFQKECLEKMKNLIKTKEIKKHDVAYLTDRVLVREKKKQLFGTQFRVINNKFESFPIQSLTDLSRRRKLYGLELFNKYAKKFDNKDVARYKKLFQKPKKT